MMVAYYHLGGNKLKSIKVKQMMIPLSAYPTVSKDASLYDAIIALDKARKNFKASQYLHRAVLVLDAGDHVKGKVSMLTILSALEPKYDQITDSKIMPRSGLNPEYLKSMVEKYSLWEKPLEDICAKATGKKVKDFMYVPTKGEYVEEEETLNYAVHLLVLGKHQSLLVTKDDKITGVLRLTDVVDHVCELAKTCKI
jgi:CBS domain-containing protein